VEVGYFTAISCLNETLEYGPENGLSMPKRKEFSVFDTWVFETRLIGVSKSINWEFPIYMLGCLAGLPMLHHERGARLHLPEHRSKDGAPPPTRQFPWALSRNHAVEE